MLGQLEEGVTLFRNFLGEAGSGLKSEFASESPVRLVTAGPCA